ncbi:MAG: hypothetical protein V6Z89_05290 [Desulfobacter sp.]
MKKVCFFPFTHMGPEQVRAVTAFFNDVSFLSLGGEISSGSAVSDSIRQGVLSPEVIPEKRSSGLDSRVQAYLEWTRMHRGNEKNLKSLLRDSAYFSEDTGVANIQSQIRKRADNNASAAGGRDGRRNDPLLFMKFAEIWDMEREVIEKDLSVLDADTSALFEELRGESVDIPGKAAPLGSDRVPLTDPGQIMTEERVVSWFGLAHEAGMLNREDGQKVLVTTSPAVMDYLVSNAEQVINGLDIESIKVHENGCACKERWQQDMINILDEPLLSNAPSWMDTTENNLCCGLSGQIQCRILSGGNLEKNIEFPGGRIVVCLVKLNS